MIIDELKAKGIGWESEEISLSFPGQVLRSINEDGLVKSRKSDGTVKSSGCKARESLGMRRTYQSAAMTKDEAQRRRWPFYEAVNGAVR